MELSGPAKGTGAQKRGLAHRARPSHSRRSRLRKLAAPEGFAAPVPSAVLCLIIFLSSTASSAPVALKGYLKTYIYSVEPAAVRGWPAAQADGSYAASENKFRLKAYWDGGRLKAEGAYELIFTARHPELAAARPLAAGYGYRVADTGALLSGGPGDSSVLIQNLDRAFITWSPPAFDLYAGRQALAFGSGRAVNPTDILAPYPYGTIDTEERRGVDAVRLKVPSGEMGELDAGWLPGEDWSPSGSAAFLRGRGMAAGADIKLISAVFRRNFMAGADVERHLGGAMLRAEAAQVWAGALGDRESREDFFRLTAGAEYNFPVMDGTDVWLEYHYNGAGAGSPRDYTGLSGRTAYREANVYLLGRHYLAFGAGAAFSPLVYGGFGALVNIEDRSFYATPSLEWNASEDLYVSAGALLPSGPHACFDGVSAVPASEFGLSDRSAYASLRFYF